VASASACWANSRCSRGDDSGMFTCIPTVIGELVVVSPLSETVLDAPDAART